MKKRPLICSNNKKASTAAAIEERAMSDGWRKVRKMIKGAFPEEKELAFLGYYMDNEQLIKHLIMMKGFRLTFILLSYRDDLLKFNGLSAYY